jgi:TonB-linked SusC/RagA family outer membrane protein
MNLNSVEGHFSPRHFSKSSLALTLTTILFLTVSTGSSAKNHSLSHFLITKEKPSEHIAVGKISGVVTDEKGVTLPGVSVKVKGAKITAATTTDATGKFSIEAADDAILIFSYVGFAPQEVAVSSRQNINVILKASISSLDEVVVVGYGTQKKATLTGAISTIGSDVFKDRAVSNPVLGIQGEIPGVVVTRTSSRPGNENLNIRIRGESSIATGKNAVVPLVVVDGVPTVDWNNDNNLNGGLWELSQLNPDDIESMTVLKDASAAIYGARAAGGVILITTKRGKGSVKVNYNANLRINTLGRVTPLANMSQYGQMFLHASDQDGVNNFWIYDRARVEKFIVGEPFLWTDPNNQVVTAYDNNNWMDQLYGTAQSQQHNLSLTGATDKMGVRFSLGFADNQGMLKTAYDGEKKYNTRFNFDYKLSKKIRLESGISYDKKNVSSPIMGVGDGWFDPPIFPTRNVNNEWYDVFGYRNPVAKTTDGGRVSNTEEILRLNLKATAELLDGLTLTGQASSVMRKGFKKQYWQTFVFKDWTGGRTTNTKNADPGIQEDMGTTNYQNYGGFLDYKKTFAKNHNISVMGGVTAELNEDKRLMARRVKLLYAGLYDLNTADPLNATNTGGANHWGLISYVTRLNYNYKSKYLLEFVGRNDASSRFDANDRWSSFGGFSAGYRISEEKFMKALPFINDLKLRGGYGEMGGQANIGLYDYVPLVGVGTSIFGTGYTQQQTAYANDVVSNDRTWERIGTKNIGFDFSALNNRLFGSADYYVKKNDGMLIKVDLPQVLGADAPTLNYGVLKVKGWEAQIGWRDKIKGFSYNASFLLSDNKNNLVSMYGRDSWNAGYVSLRQGYPLNSIYVYKTDGYFQSQEEVDAYYAEYTKVKNGELPANVAGQRLRPGDLKKVDLDGNGYISAIGDPSKGDTGDVEYIGDAAPHYSFGINLGASWKGFDFSSFLQGIGKQNIIRGGNLNAPFRVLYVNQNPNYLGKTWTESNPNAEYPRMSLVGGRNGWNYNNTDIMVQNLRYIRMKTLILGYTLPKVITKKMSVDRFRIYFSGNDLFEFTSIKDGYDPEFGENSNQTYPFARTWSFGLDLTL